MMSIQDMSRIIIKMERELKLFELEISDIPVWWFARDRVLAYLFKIKNGINMTASSSESLSFFEMLKKVIDSLHINNFKKHDILAVSTSSARRMVVDGKDYDVYFDFFAMTDFKDRYSIIETPDLSNHSPRPYSPSRYFGDYMSLRGNLARRYPIKAKNYLIDFCDNISSYLRVNEGLEASINTLMEIIVKEFQYAKVSVAVAGNCIDKINPRVLLVECGYSPSHMAFQLAAKIRNIPVVEIQHGLIVPDSLGYFCGLDSGAKLDRTPFPDKIFLFGNHFKKILQKNAFINDDMTPILGHPLIYSTKGKYKSNSENGKIVICTQPELREFFVQIILELSKRIENQIIIKPHPSEYSRIDQLYEPIKALNNVFIVQPDNSLYDLFSQAEYHVSAASMTHLEAICFGLKDIILECDCFLGYYDFLKDMGLPVAYNVDHLIEIINHYPNIDNIQSYVDNDIFSLKVNPFNEIDKLIKQYL